MAGVVATPLSGKRGRSKAVAFSDFFGAKVKTLLLRTRSVVHTLPSEIGSEAATVLTDLDPFADAGSLKDVFDMLGGEKKLACQLFVSVMDEGDRADLEMYTRKRGQQRGDQQRQILKELQSLVGRAQELAKQLPSDPLVKQVLALSTPATVEDEEDEAGTGEQESLGTEEKKKKRQQLNKAKEQQLNKAKEQQSKKAKELKEPKRQQSNRPKESAKPKKKKSNASTKSGANTAKKSVIAVAPVGEAVQEDEGAALDADEGYKHNHLSDDDVLRLITEGERELAEIQLIAKGNVGGVAVPLNVPGEGPPNVKQLIHSATLDNLWCLAEQEVALNTAEAHMILQVWWRIAKRACQIYGLFQLLRAQKSKLKTLPERYAALVKDQSIATLGFRQAGKYDRLGSFLAQFPLFVYQRKWTTLTDWFQKANDDVLVDCMTSIVPVSCAFIKDGFTLNTHGFQVLPGLMTDCINDALVAACKTGCEREGEVIFNNVKGVDARHNDKKRVQLSVDKIVEAAAFKAALTVRLLQHFPRHTVDAMVALMSKLMCKAQLEHTDYSPKTLAGATDETMPLASLCALMDGTLFDVWPGAIRFDKSRTYKPMQIKLNKGDVLIFRGDLVHAGAACLGETENVRIHAYLDVAGIQRPKHGDGAEETHFMCDEKCIGKRMK